MGQFSDCESCAFHHVEDAICDDCADGDQWEDADPVDSIKPNATRIWQKEVRFTKTKKAA